MTETRRREPLRHRLTEVGAPAAALRRRGWESDGSYRNPETWRCSGTCAWRKEAGEGCWRR
jgi:hypothetical protein